MEIVPLRDMLQIEIETLKTTASGIVLSQQGKPTAVATILKTPENMENISIGDRVAINQYAPIEITVDDTKISLIGYEDIYCIIKG